MKIHTKLLLFILLIVFCLNSVAFFLYYSSRNIQSSYSEIIERFLLLNDVSKIVDNNLQSLNYFLLDDTTAEKIILQKNRKELIAIRKELDSLGVRNDNEVNLRNYKNLLDTFIEEIETVVQIHEFSRFPDYVNYREAEKTASYIKEQTRKLIDLELTAFHPVFLEMKLSHKTIYWYGISIFLVSTALGIVFALWFSNGLTNPISHLVRSARRVSFGDFTEVKISSKDEIGVLGEVFNTMQNNIKRLIDEIKKKANLEKALQEQALKNIEMDRTLKSLELKALQSQINPHFLFNTLNVISKLTFIEGAEKSSDLITSVSKIFRYNLGRLDRPATFSMELNQIKEYFKIQEVRFRDRIQISWNVDESCLDWPIPSLTLQPIVENAFLHGIDTIEKGAHINVFVKKIGDRAMIRISDNGIGMSQEKVDQVLSQSETLYKAKEGHTTGLGLHNVATRLRLFYGDPECFQIQSAPQKGTTIILILPRIEEEVNMDVQTVNR